MAQAAAALQAGMIFEEDDRESFAAYITDEASHAAALAVTAPRGWSPSSIRRGGLATALRMLGVAPPARILIVDIEGEAIEEVIPGLTELARLGAHVLVLGTVNDVTFARRIMLTGAKDYLVKPIDAETLGEIFVRIEQSDGGGVSKGHVVGVIGARGGVGATTVAINAAFLMSEKLSRRTALVDMDIYAGSIALSLDLEPTHGLREAFDDPERVDQIFLQNAMAKIGKGLHVLATEEAFDDTVRMSDDKMIALADIMRANFDMSIMDLPRHFVLREPALFSRFDDIVLVAELTLQSLRDTNRLLKLLAMRNGASKLHVVANKVSGRPDVTEKEFEAGLEAKLRCVFPHDAKAMTRSALKGQPLAIAEPKHRVVTHLHRLCMELAGVPEEVKTGFFRSRSVRK